MTHLVTTDKRKQPFKPTGKEVGVISKNLKYQLEVTPEKLLKKTTQPYGYSWSPAVFSGKRSNNNWLEQSIFALDFDDGTEPELIINRFTKCGIRPNIIYYTFSSAKQHPKFRLIFFFDQKVKKEQKRDKLQCALMDIGKECDNACKDASRMYFGGKDGKVLSQSVNSLQTILELAEIQTITKDSGQTRKINTIRPSNSRVGVQKNSKSITNNNGSTKLLQDHTATKTVEWYEKHQKNRKNKSVDIEKLVNKIKILNAFANDEWLFHDELFGLATNLYWIRGGFKWMKNVMSEFNKRHRGEVSDSDQPIQYNKDNFHILKYISKKNKTFEGDFYMPQSLETFSPYEADHKYRNLLEVISKPKGFVRKLKEKDKISLKKAELIFDKKFQEAMIANNNKIYLFKLPTGIGKTEKITNLEETLICAPTHKLKNKDIVSMMKQKGLCPIVTPELPEFEQTTLNRSLRKCFKAGFSGQANNLIHKIANGSNSDAEKAQEYLNKMNRAYGSTKNVVTTHPRGVYTEFDQKDTVIFDEDPFSNTLLETNSLKISDLHKLVGDLESKRKPENLINFLENFRDQLQSLKKGDFIKTPTCPIDNEVIINAMIKVGSKINILKVLKSNYLTIDSQNSNKVNYIISRSLPEKKILIMSATIKENLYKKLFPQRDFEVLDLSGRVDLTGEILQYTKRSCSRRCLSRSYDEINQKLDENPTLTFPEYVDRIKGAVKEIYFGNLLGRNPLTGIDINVVGTPHRNPSEYLLTALELDIPIDSDFNHIENLNHQMIEWGGYEYRFHTYNHEALRNIQLSTIQSDLIQAVGRARALREEVTVKVYSNMPVPQAEIVRRW